MSDLTPVSSPTPDEQAAEERKGRIAALLRDHQIAAFNYAQSACDRCNEWMTHERYRKHLTDLLAADCEAALVVVREQLTRVEEENRRLRGSLTYWRAQADPTIDADKLDALLYDLSAYHDYPATLRRTDAIELAAAIRAALNAPPSPPTYTTEEPS